jgi:catechol 2,3-dioxygenase
MAAGPPNVSRHVAGKPRPGEGRRALAVAAASFLNAVQLKWREKVMGKIHAKLAHVGIHAHDMPLLEKFYTTVLGLVVTDKGKSRNLDMELTFMSSSPANHHQFVLVSGRPDTSGFNPINQISFMVDTLSDLREVHNRALANGATGMRVTCHGNAWSCYFKDPEGNTVEAYLDTPFHVPQPHGAPFDLMASDEEILRWTEDHCRADPGFMMMDEYQAKMAKVLTN